MTRPAHCTISRTWSRYLIGFVLPALALAIAACSTSSSSPGIAAQPDEQSPVGDVGTEKSDAQPLRLVVVIIIDQLPSWSFEGDSARLDGGIARLLREGAYYPRVEIPYAITYTAPGHAAIGTGAPPAVTRILANGWYFPALKLKLSATFDPGSPVFSIVERPPGTPPSFGASGKRLVVDGVADVLRRDTGGKGRSVSVSLKGRSAIFASGRQPDIAVWYDPLQAAVTTSRQYVDSAPAWLQELASEHPIRPRLAAYQWTRLADVDHAAMTGIIDAIPGESEEQGLGNAFPYQPSKSRSPERSLRSMPLADDIVLEATYAAMAAERLGQDDVADLLTISFSAHDQAAHNWGQESWERLDLLLRLDDKLGAFLQHLDERVGKGRYAVLLTSDHGATPMVEHSTKANKPAGRISYETVLGAVNQAAVSVLGEGQWAIELAASSVYMSDDFAARSAADRERALDAAVVAVRALPGMAYAARTDQIGGECERRAGMEALACRSVVVGMSGAIFVAAAENYLLTRYTTGTGHGAPSLHDRQIPLIVSAPGWTPGRVADAQVSILQIAPTVASLLGVGAPPAAKSPALRP